MKVSKTVFPENPSRDYNEWAKDLKESRMKRLLEEAGQLDLCDLIEFKREVERLLINKLKK